MGINNKAKNKLIVEKWLRAKNKFGVSSQPSQSRDEVTLRLATKINRFGLITKVWMYTVKIGCKLKQSVALLRYPAQRGANNIGYFASPPTETPEVEVKILGAVCSFSTTTKRYCARTVGL